MLSFTDPAVTVSEADAYALARAYAGWTGTDVVKAAALRRGQDFIAGQYNARWGVTFDNDDAPDEVKYAIIEAAVLEAATPGVLSAVVKANERIKRAKAAAVEVEFADGGDTLAGAVPVVSKIEGLLEMLLARHMPGILVV